MTGSVASLRRRRGSARRLLCPIVDPVAGGEQQPLPLMDPAPPSSVRRPSRRIQLRRRAALVRAVVASSSARPAIRRSRIPLLEVAAVFLPRPPVTPRRLVVPSPPGVPSVAALLRSIQPWGRCRSARRGSAATPARRRAWGAGRSVAALPVVEQRPPLQLVLASIRRRHRPPVAYPVAGGGCHRPQASARPPRLASPSAAARAPFAHLRPRPPACRLHASVSVRAVIAA